MKNSDLQIADQIISNQINLERFTAGEKKRVIEILFQMQKELKVKLSGDLTDYGKARVTKLLKECTAVINEYYSGIQQELDLTGLAKQQAEVTQRAIASIGLDVSLPSASVLKAMVSDTLLQGAPLADWWAKQADDTAFKFAAQVRQGVAQSETMQEIITRIAGSKKHGTTGIMEVSRRNASALVHDSIMKISGDANMAVYQDNIDIMKGYRWLSTLDSITCIKCVARSGLQWDLKLNPIGHSIPFVRQGDLHTNCRCPIVPILKSYRELGINIDEMKPGTRSSDLGQVPADMSFDAFLKRHDANYVDELLGKGKAQLWRDGKITLSQLISQEGRPLTLNELKAA
ncbi:MAG: hypothetical protein PHW03_05485 [Eubacteriales bacterium]|nr:hypothetical protein [Eubacteriales bacterium]